MKNKLDNFLSPRTEYSINRKIINFEEVYEESSIGKKGFQLFLRPTEFCNFSCEYCFNYSKEKIEWNLIDIDNLENYLKTLEVDNLRIYIHGGEPITFKYLNILVEMLSKYADVIDLQTNLALFETDNKIWKFSKLKFSISVHESANMKKMIPKIDFLFSKDKVQRLDVILSKDNKRLMNWYKVLKYKYPITQTIGIFQDVQTLYEKVDIDSYNDRKFRVEYSEHPENTPQKEELSFYGVYKKSLVYNMKELWCEAGWSGFLINNDGLIYRCQSDMNFKRKAIGNLREDNFPERKWQVCGNDYCVADFEYRRHSDPTKIDYKINSSIGKCEKYDGKI